MSKPTEFLAIKALLKSQFEPFFGDEILPELEVPEEFVMQYESAHTQSFELKVRTEDLRIVKDHLKSRSEERVGWTSKDGLIRICPEMVLISQDNFAHHRTFDHFFNLEMYTKDNKECFGEFGDGDMMLHVVWISPEGVIVEYVEFLSKGKFRSLDFRSRVSTPEERTWMNRNEYIDWPKEIELVTLTPTPYLGSFLTFMDVI